MSPRELALLYAKLDSAGLVDGVERYAGSVELDSEELEYLRELIGQELDALQTRKRSSKAKVPAAVDHPGQRRLDEEEEHVATVRLGGGAP